MTRQQKMVRLDQGVKQMLFEAMSNGFGPATTKIREETNIAIGLGPDDLPAYEELQDDPEPSANGERPVHNSDLSEQEDPDVGDKAEASSGEDQVDNTCPDCGRNIDQARRDLKAAVDLLNGPSGHGSTEDFAKGVAAVAILDAHHEADDVDDIYLSVPQGQRAFVLGLALQKVIDNKRRRGL